MHSCRFVARAHVWRALVCVACKQVCCPQPHLPTARPSHTLHMGFARCPNIVLVRRGRGLPFGRPPAPLARSSHHPTDPNLQPRACPRGPAVSAPRWYVGTTASSAGHSLGVDTLDTSPSFLSAAPGSLSITPESDALMSGNSGRERHHIGSDPGEGSRRHRARSPMPHCERGAMTLPRGRS